MSNRGVWQREQPELTHADDLIEIVDKVKLRWPETSSLPRRRRREPWGARTGPSLLAAGSRARARGTATAPRASHSSPGLPHASDDDQETADELAGHRPHSPTQRSWEKGSIRGVRPSHLRTRPQRTQTRPRNHITASARTHRAALPRPAHLRRPQSSEKPLAEHKARAPVRTRTTRA